MTAPSRDSATPAVCSPSANGTARRTRSKARTSSGRDRMLRRAATATTARPDRPATSATRAARDGQPGRRHPKGGHPEVGVELALAIGHHRRRKRGGIGMLVAAERHRRVGIGSGQRLRALELHAGAVAGKLRNRSIAADNLPSAKHDECSRQEQDRDDPNRRSFTPERSSPMESCQANGETAGQPGSLHGRHPQNLSRRTLRPVDARVTTLPQQRLRRSEREGMSGIGSTGRIDQICQHQRRGQQHYNESGPGVARSREKPT